MDDMKEYLDKQFAAKAEWRRQRAALPFEEKIRILVKLQRRRAAILRERGVESMVWEIEEIQEK